MSHRGADPLLAGLAAGREEAFAALYDRYAGRMLRAALGWLGRREDAEDAVQEVFTAMVRSRRKLAGVNDLAAYLFRALRRAAGRIAERRGSDPILVSMLVAIAIDKTAAETLQAVVRSSQVSEADLEGLDLDAGLAYPRLFERSLRMEEAFGTSVFCDVASGQVGIHELVGDSGAASHADLGSLYRVFLLADDVAANRRFMRRYREMAGKPYYAVKPEWEGFEAELE